MFGKKSVLRRVVSLAVAIACVQTGLAHQPDLSSLMIYEQNGKSILLIKSSLTAFEGEMDYHFGKDAYKTPEAFQELVIAHFRKNCVVTINNQTIKFVNHQVILGHETSLFAELSNPPKPIASLYVKNTVFKDIPNNLCEVILSMGNLPQKQLLLGANYQYAAQLNIENGSWIIADTTNAFYQNRNFVIAVGVILALVAVYFLTMHGQKKSTA